MKLPGPLWVGSASVPSTISRGGSYGTRSEGSWCDRFDRSSGKILLVDPMSVSATLADEIDTKLIARWIGADYVVAKGEVAKRIENMSQSRRHPLSLPRPPARGWPGACSPAVPTGGRRRARRLSARTLHRLLEIKALANDRRVVATSWIDAEALDAV